MGDGRRKGGERLRQRDKRVEEIFILSLLSPSSF